MRNTTRSFYLHVGMVLLAALLFSTMGPVLRNVEQYGVSRLFIAWMRASIPAALIIVYAGFRRPEDLCFGVRELPRLLLYGFCCIALLYTVVNQALARLPIGLAILLFYTTPLWVILLTRILGLERLTPLRILALIAGAAGLFFAVGMDIRGRLDSVGVLCALVAGFANALYMIAGRYGMGQYHPFRMFTHMYLWGSLILGAFCLFTGDVRYLVEARQPAVWGGILYMALMTSLLGNMLIMKSLQKVPSSAVSILCMSEIAVGMLWAWMFYHEIPSRNAIIGGFFLVSAVVLVTFERELKRRGSVG